MQIRLTIVLIFISIFFAGCFSSNPEDIRAFKRPYEVDVTSENYILQPADEIHISSSDVPEIHDQRQKIRPDGKISFELIGEFQAAGKTPEELSDDIKAKANEFYKLPDNKPVDILISTYQSKYFYIFGQVHLPGPRLYSGREPVSKAINLAQPNALAWEERIQVIRPSSDPNEKPAIFEINYNRLKSRGDESKDVLLEEGDIIYVPPTVLGWIALKVEEFVSPITRAFSGAYTVRRGMDYNRRENFN